MCKHAKFDTLTLEDILLDPITVLLMERDNVQKDYVRNLMARVTPSRKAVFKDDAKADIDALLMAG